MMHVTVALENRFRKSANGNVYSTTVCDYKFWQRYLEVFNSVSVFARVLNKAETELALNVSNGPNVSFIELPTFIGPWQFLTEYKRIRAFAKNAVKGGEAFILRIPGTIGTVLWQELMRKDLPYGVEVVGDPWDSLGPGSVRSIVRPFLRIKARMDMAKQCRFASAASYVTKYSLQRRYEPGCR
jgi:phosphatidylinositol alpha-1,6-mannosyltransferase